MKRPIKLIQSIWLIITIAIMICGCQRGEVGVKSTFQELNSEISNSGGESYNSMPTVKSDGTKFRIAYVDIDPYPVTGEALYYVIESLKEDGWIEYDTLPFEIENVNAKELILWLADRDLGPYIEFVKEATYYTKYDSEETIKKSLTKQCEEGKIDLILAMGTQPALLVKSFGLEVPMIVYGCVDPVRAGIVKDNAYSGEPYVWAQVDTKGANRQLQFYYDTIPFKNIGMVYNDEVTASIADYEQVAKENHFDITKVKIDKLVSDESKDVEAYYNQLTQIYDDLVVHQKIDAYLLNTDVIIDEERTQELLKVFTENKIPVFVQIGEGYVKNGALMQVSPREYKGLGYFISNRIGCILNGAKPDELLQEYANSPFLSINLDTAEKIGFIPSFEMMLSSENIYVSEDDEREEK